MKNVVIIGGGVSGLTCGIYLGRFGFDVKIFNNYSLGCLSETKFVENFPGFPDGISGNELMNKIERQAKNNGCVVFDNEVTQINKSKKFVVTDNDKIFRYDYLVVATGSVTMKIAYNYSNIHYCATCDGVLYKDKKVMVIGGGNTAITEALYLSQICKEVVLVHRRNVFKADYKLMEKLRNQKNISIMTNFMLKEVEGQGCFKRIVIKQTNGENEIEYKDIEGMFVAIGIIKRDELLGDYKQIDSSIEGYKNIYLCGDIHNEYRQAIIASADGAKIAMMIQDNVNKNL